MSQSVSELEQEVETARTRLDQTLGAIQERMTVAGIIDELVGTVSKPSVRSGLDTALAVAKNNPLPLMIVAAGVGWYLHRLGRKRQSALREASVAEEPLPPLLNTGHARVYDPDASTRHPAQDSLESRRDLTAHA